MYKKIIVSAIVLLTVAFSVFSAEKHSGKVMPAKKSILIVKDSSELETAVSRIIVDTLSKLGYTVKEVGLADIGKENAPSYKFSIVFSAVNPGEEIEPSVQKFMASANGKSSKVLLYSVYGNVHTTQDKNVDATTQATKELHPPMIAEHILHSLKL
jgi:hypothetical protein